MPENLGFGTIPKEKFHDYRIDVMFDGYKWDLQAGEQSTISDKAVLLEQECLDFLSKSAVSLYHETVAMEQVLKSRPNLMLQMGISEKMSDALFNCRYDPSEHIRLMRFDFHPTTSGWKISEVNSDVPAGYPEASVLPEIAAKFFPGYKPCVHFGNVLADNFTKLIPPNSTIAYLHDTRVVEDCQLLHFIGDLLEQRGHQSLYVDPTFIKWEDNRALGIGAILRYYPVEWLEHKKGVDWISFVNSKTVVCNHPIALLTQSKRLPVVWDELGVKIPTWRQLLPETIHALPQEPDWILKPAFGRVGEGINIPGTVSAVENLDIKKAASNNPTQWIAQKMFESRPINGIHLSLGVFVVNGEFAGLFGRTSKHPRMDSEASEVPVLVESRRTRFPQRSKEA